ncbi:MAG: glycosyltransferase family 2 protein [Actinomycetota bacterium]
MNTPPAAPSVSVVVATRNRPELLRKALGSIAVQDYPGQVELVVVYDQSEPETDLAADLELTGQAGDRSVRVITNTRTPGLAGARNSGVTGSSGELLAFCDDDDSWRPDKLRSQVAMLTATNAGLSVCGIQITIGEQTHIRIPTPADVTVAELARRRVMEAHPSTVLVRRTAFDRIGWVDEELPGGYAEDYDWMLRATAEGPLAAVEAPLITVHWHGGSWFQDRWQTMAAALTELLDRHPDFRREPKGRARILGQIAFARAAEGRSRLGRRLAMQALRLNPLEMRAYLTFVVSMGLLSPERVLDVAHRFGKGI